MLFLFLLRWERGLTQPESSSEKEVYFRLCSDVVLLPEDGIVRVLHLDGGAFYCLNETASELLPLLLDCEAANAIRDFATIYNVDEAVIAQDADQVLCQLQALRLVERVELAPFRPPSTFALWVNLLFVWMSLRCIGWRRTLSLWSWGGVRSPVRFSEFHRASILEFDRRLRSASAIHPMRTECKEKSVVAWGYLRHRLGLPAELVVGVLNYPFQVHAWVECGPLTLTDDAERAALFTPASRYT